MLDHFHHLGMSYMLKNQLVRGVPLSYIIFIDDLTRMCWIYFLKHKSKAAATF